MWSDRSKLCLAVGTFLISFQLASGQDVLTIGASLDAQEADLSFVPNNFSATPDITGNQVNTIESLNATSDEDMEVIRERFKNGQVHIEKQMKLDSQGNYVNHGYYREFTSTGEVAVEGHYESGKAHGAWLKRLSSAETRHVQQQLNVTFKPPFISTVEFSNGLPTQMWTITDKDQKTIVHIELDMGVRHGLTTIYLPSGELKSQATYDKGVLAGTFIERRQNAQATDLTFIDGRRVESEVLYHPNRKVKSKHEYLTAVYKVGEVDDWTTSTFAKLLTEGERQLHGAFVVNHEDGSLATSGAYEHGKLNGPFRSLHRNGELAATGEYHNGQRDGTWIWRYPNGMKESQATYKNGEVVGSVLAWDKEGRATMPMEGRSNSVKRVEASTASRSILITE